ncbi:MAG: hypothetical protein CVV63_03970, partial [Tenericutes bacterium HGW-Tenericutes-8]
MKKIVSIFVLFALTFVLAACQPKTYTVTFESNGGQTVPSITVETGEKMTEPTAPTKTGYTF